MPETSLSKDPLLRDLPEVEGYKVLGGVVLYQKLGQGVIFDAGRPGGVDDGELVVVEPEHEVVVKPRQTAGGFRQYVSVNSKYPSINVRLDDVPNEYPVLGVILKPRRSVRRRR